MYSGKLVFAQVMDHLPMHTFRQAVRRYGGNRYVKSFPCHSQFLCMAFAQLTYRESLRDIEVCMRAPAAQTLSLGHSKPGVAQHARQREQAARLADLRRGRAGVDSHCTADVRRRGPGTGSRQHGVCPGRFDHRLSVFPWAPFRSKKAAVKLHTLSTCAARFRRSCMCPTAKWLMFTRSTASSPSLGRPLAQRCFSRSIWVLPSADVAGSCNHGGAKVRGVLVPEQSANEHLFG